MGSIQYQISMHKINIVFFSILFILFSCSTRAQTENKAIPAEPGSADKASMLFNTNAADCISLPFGYPDLSKRTTADATLPIIQDEHAWKQINALKFETPIKKELVSLPEEYDVYLPFSRNTDEKYDRIRIASGFLCRRDYALHFMAVYNTVRYAEPFIEKIYLISTKDNKPVDMKRIYLHHEGEMGFSRYTLFHIGKDNIISLQDYEFTEGPFRLQPMQQYQVLPSGKFARYYDKDGPYQDEEEQGTVKNHLKEGKWLEFKANSSTEMQKHPEFTDPYTYVEAEYKNGLPTGTWKFYKLLQKYDEETGAPIIKTRKKGPLTYTETYKNGIVQK